MEQSEKGADILRTGKPRYEAAAAVLPSRLRQAALELPAAQREAAEELRLRSGGELTALVGEEEISLCGGVTAEELETLCDIAADFSRYAAMETLREGYLSVRGGFRLGLCGTVVMKDGAAANLKHLTSAALRIGREHPGIGEALLPRITEGGRFQNTLILSPPGGGKTTLLRDLVRSLSNGGYRVALVDERGEVAVCHQGKPQMDVGRRTDVLDGCPKAIGIPMVLRAMNPRVIAVDEITLREDIRAMVMAAGCGVGLLATVHAASVEELLERPLYRELLEHRVFRLAIRIGREGGRRTYTVEELTE